MHPPSATILVVEDDADTRQTLWAVLAEEGYTILAVASLAEATEILGQRLVDLVITDLFATNAQAPLDSALPLLHEAQPTPVGVLTAWNLASEDAQAHGFAWLIAKPFDLADMLATVAATLITQELPTFTAQVAIIEQYCVAFNGGDVATCLTLCAEDIVFIPPVQTPFGHEPEIRGHTAYRAHLVEGLRLVPEFRFEERHFFVRPHGVAMQFVESWATPAGRTSMTASMLFDFAEDRISTITVALNPTRLAARLHSTNT